MSADIERTIVGHYNLPSANPIEWPAELDESDEEVDDKAGLRRSQSRYSALERAASNRKTLLPGSQRTGDGKTNLVQKDEPDPLGGGGSVISVLRNRGLPVDQDMRLRNKFLLSSTTFSPALFLSQSHSTASTDDLVRGLDVLSRSIDQKAQSLKVLVETNFERFVRAKATIDNVYSEMRDQGVETPAQNLLLSARHSRQTSRTSGIHSRHFSSSSANQTQNQAPNKNALRKETEYGVAGIKAPLLEVSQRAGDVWGPALGGREREASLKAVVEAIEKDRQLYELGGELSVTIRQKNYERAVELYNSARNYALQATTLGERASQSGLVLTDEQIHKILVTGRMWADVEDQVKSLRRDIWRRLTNVKSIAPSVDAGQAEEHMDLIGILLELGVEDNPIWVWLLSRYDNLKNKIGAVVDRSKVEIEILRRRLAASETASPEICASYLRQAVKENPEELDNEQVIDFWKTLMTYVTKLLSSSNGLLGEILDFWESAQSFIEGDKQRALPTGYQGESRKHHRLSEAGVKDLQNGVVDLVNLIRDALLSLFADAPTEDISALFSPSLSSSAQTPNTPFGTTFSPSEGRIGNLNEQAVPNLYPKKGDGWEEFAFWPPRSNALCAVHYLGGTLALLGSGCSEMAALAPVSSNNATCEKIKYMVVTARERSLRAICEAWNKDAESCKYLEDWLRSPEHRNQTRLPTYFSAFEKKIVSGLQKTLYMSEATSKPGSREIVSPPATKLLQMVRTQFVNSIYKALSGMLENAETMPQPDEDEWAIVARTIQGTHSLDGVVEAASTNIDAKNRNVRMLLTLSNLKVLKNEYVPQLIQLFESSFSVKLTDESKTISDVFSQVDSKLFQSYTKPTVAELNKIIRDGINAPSWSPKTSRPNQVSPFAYATLMRLVLVHTEVSTTVTNSGTTNTALVDEVLSFLLEKVSTALLDSFKERKPNNYSPADLIQATLDTEFITKTLTQYSSTKAEKIQGQIYEELDQRTTKDAKANLKREFDELRIVLKQLRESSRNSFGCFKRHRISEDRPRGRV